MKSVRILCVDDEPRVLEGLSLHLRRKYDVVTAESGADGLQAIKDKGPFAVVLSDMRMPRMDGTVFLKAVREMAPDTVRMLLTGQADLQSTIDAVNKGQIFRFLTKPCPSQQLMGAFEAATEQYRLVMAERVLLEQTLHGSIKALTDILALSNPVAFGSATRIKQYAGDLARHLGIGDWWQIEVAAMLSQLGSITLPEGTAKKYYYGQELDNDEIKMIQKLPRITQDLIGNIPRLETVCEILTNQFRDCDKSSGADDVIYKSQVLKIAVDFDQLVNTGSTEQDAIDRMHGKKSCYDCKILEAFAYLRGVTNERETIREIRLWSINLGMVLVDDVTLDSGVVLATRGYEVNEGFIECIHNLKHRISSDKVRVVMPQHG